MFLAEFFNYLLEILNFCKNAYTQQWSDLERSGAHHTWAKNIS